METGKLGSWTSHSQSQESYRSEVVLGLEDKHLLLENTLALSANPKEVKCHVR